MAKQGRGVPPTLLSPYLQEPDAVWWQLLECGFDSWHPTCHPGFMLHQGDCNLLFKVPVKKGFMKVGHSVALVNVYCYSDRLLSGTITFVRPELQAGKHRYPGKGCWHCTHALFSGIWLHVCVAMVSILPPWDFCGDIRMQRDLPTQAFISVHQ